MVTKVKIISFLFVLLLPTWTFAYHPMLVGVVGKQGVSDSYTDLVFFWTAESTTFGEDDYSAGDNTPTATGSGLEINSTAGIIGTNGVYIPTSGSRYYLFDVASNDIIPATGRAGFWYTSTDLSTATIPIYWQLTTADRADLTITGNDVVFTWRDGNVSRTTCSTSTDVIANGEHFIEIAWDTNYREVFIDGSSVLNCTTTTTQQSPTSVRFGDNDVTADSAEKYMDNVMISNDKTRNLYSLRNLTASPR